MANTADISAWIAIAFGLYSIAAGIGLFSAPDKWRRMAMELDQSAALGFLVGVVVFALGFAILMVNPCGGDWLAIAVSLIGGAMALEGLAFLALPKIMGKMARALLDGGRLNRLWALLSILIGIALALAGFLHLQMH